MFNEFVDVTNKVCGHNAVERWSPPDTTKLRRDKQQFKVNGDAVVGAYQKREMETFKLHVLYRITEDLIINGGLFSCDARIYKYSHIISRINTRKP